MKLHRARYREGKDSSKVSDTGESRKSPEAWMDAAVLTNVYEGTRDSSRCR